MCANAAVIGGICVAGRVADTGPRRERAAATGERCVRRGDDCDGSCLPFGLGGTRLRPAGTAGRVSRRAGGGGGGGRVVRLG